MSGDVPPACVAAAPAAVTDLLGLAKSPSGTFESPDWQIRAVHGRSAPQVTVHDSADVKFLRISGQSRAAFIVRSLAQPVAPHGRLEWIQRIPLSPAGADMRHAVTDDSPLRLFVVFHTGGFFARTRRVLFYSNGRAEPVSWSAPSAVSRDLHVIRISTAGNESDWTAISVEPAADYVRTWGGSAPCIVAFGVMQDTDQTHSAAIAELHHLIWRSHVPSVP